MPDTIAAQYPVTPAQVAGAVLDAIEQERQAFNMNSWFWQPGGGSLAPDERPACGTTMCVAGWAAHVTGWTLSDLSAKKNGTTRGIEAVAYDALGLDDETDYLFYTDSDNALTMLRAIAGR